SSQLQCQAANARSLHSTGPIKCLSPTRGDASVPGRATDQLESLALLGRLKRREIPLPSELCCFLPLSAPTPSTGLRTHAHFCALDASASASPRSLDLISTDLRVNLDISVFLSIRHFLQTKNAGSVDLALPSFHPNEEPCCRVAPPISSSTPISNPKHRFKMQFKSIFIVAASAAMAMAGDVEEDITTTSTSTMTRTVTITECNPTATECPGNWSKPNSTISAKPTWYHGKNESSWAVPTQKPTVIETIAVTATPTKAKTTTVPTSGANALFLQSGFMLSLLSAGVALLA
ncbi:hypothetical protein B0T16DRAFT_42273, partial [Cercophora newfieldiana]